MSIEDNPAGFKIEGDRTTWHIRMTRRCGSVEVWQLFCGDEPQSSMTPKHFAEQWRDEELERLKQ